MTDQEKDLERYSAATFAILDNRNPATSFAHIMMTLEATIAATLLALTEGDARKAALLLNNALVPGVENRLSWAARVIREVENAKR